MSARLIPEAEKDLEDIALYIALQDNPQSAKQFRQELIAVADKLAEYPFHDTNKRNYLHPDLRQSNYKKHAIIYRPESDGMTVVGVYRGSYIDRVTDRLNERAAALSQEDKRRELAKAVLREHGPAAGRRAETPAKGKEKGREPDR